MAKSTTRNSLKKSIPKKVCPICKKDKSLEAGFYKSSSPKFPDGHVSICIPCVKAGMVNDDGTINRSKMENMLQKIDKPLYWDTLDAAYIEYRHTHSYISDDEMARHGNDILGIYFKKIMCSSDKNKDFTESKRTGFQHQSFTTPKSVQADIDRRFLDKDPTEVVADAEANVNTSVFGNLKIYAPGNYDGLEVTQDILDMFGEGYTANELRKMIKKYHEMSQTYVIQTSIHKEALVTYVRFKVKEEMATAKGDVTNAQKWYQAAQDAAEKGKLTARQISKEDLQGGIVSFSDIFSAVEGAKERIKIFPEFKYQPKDSADFIIWCYVNYERELNNMPQVEYKDIYAFYDKKKQDYIDMYGDPYNIFTDDTSESNRDAISKFITVPKEIQDGD